MSSSLTTSFPATSDNSDDYSTVKSRLTALTAVHKQATDDIAHKDMEISDLQTRLSDLSRNSQLTITALAEGKAEAEREYRWAREGRSSAEKREEDTKRVMETLRASLVSLYGIKLDHGLTWKIKTDSATGTGGSTTSDQTARIHQLEALVETLEHNLEGMSRDSREMEERITQGAGLVKQTELDTAQARIAELQAGKSPTSKRIQIYERFEAEL